MEEKEKGKNDGYILLKSIYFQEISSPCHSFLFLWYLTCLSPLSFSLSPSLSPSLPLIEYILPRQTFILNHHSFFTSFFREEERDEESERKREFNRKKEEEERRVKEKKGKRMKISDPRH